MAIALTEAPAKEINSIIQDQILPTDQTMLRDGFKGGG